MDEKPKPRSKWRMAMWITINLYLFSVVIYGAGKLLGYWR